jgi:lysyl-tRNA synthetase class 2
MEELVRSLMGGEVAIRDITVREAYRSFAGWDPWTDWDQDRFDFDMAVKVEPEIRRLGGGVFLMDYPVEAASLAKLGDGSAERWEFYWKRVELANCFTELCDAGEQRARFAAAREERRRLGEADYPLDEEFLARLPDVGSAAGVALGVDRLVMLLCGADSIEGVRAGA